MSVRAAGVPATTWPTAALIRDVDGDTAVLRLTRTALPGEDWDIVQASPTKGTRCRLVWVNTPDLPDAAGKAAGTADTVAWFAAHPVLGADSYGRDEFGRLLVDVWPVAAGVPQRDASLSRWLLTAGNQGAGWPAYKG